MMSSISCSNPSGALATARPNAVAGTGDSMASAFAMLFAMMPGMGDQTGTGTGDALPKTGDGDTKDGSTADKDGKDLPSDAAALPVMSPLSMLTPMPLAPLPLPEPDAARIASTTRSATPIAALLAAMPGLPEVSPNATSNTLAAVPDTEKVTATGMTTAPLQTTIPVATDAAAIGMMAGPIAKSIPAVANAPARDMTGAPLSKTVSTEIGTPIILDMPSPSAPAASVETIPAPQALAATPPSASNAATSPPLAVQVNAVQAAMPLSPAARATMPVTLPIDAAPVTPSSDGVTDTRARQDTPIRFAVTTASPAIATPLPVETAAPMLQPGQTAPAIRLFGLSRRSDQAAPDTRPDRRKDDAALSVDPATLTRADSLIATPVAATTGAEQAPLDMTQHHWPQGMIDRIDRMREDAATADTRIQLSPDALGGIAVALRHEDGTTHIHFTADQAQTATLLADAQPTLARLAEEKGMRLGGTAVDLGQSGAGGERQAPPRCPDPVTPLRPAFAGTSPSSDAGDPVAASTRIA